MTKKIVVIATGRKRDEIESNNELLETLKFQIGTNEIEYHDYDENDVVSMKIMGTLGDFSVPLLALVDEEGKKVCKINPEVANIQYCEELKDFEDEKK
jgi:hypothetical protein